MDRERPIKSTGKYNLNFVDWDNEYESVMDHISGIMERGLSYEENPYFDVPLSEVEFLMRDTYDCTSTGLSDSEISRLPRIRGTSRDCSICLSSSFDGIRLPCNHVFHADCIIRWLKCRVDCPNCRRSARD